VLAERTVEVDSHIAPAGEVVGTAADSRIAAAMAIAVAHIGAACLVLSASTAPVAVEVVADWHIAEAVTLATGSVGCTGAVASNSWRTGTRQQIGPADTSAAAVVVGSCIAVAVKTLARIVVVEVDSHTVVVVAKETGPQTAGFAFVSVVVVVVVATDTRIVNFAHKTSCRSQQWEAAIASFAVALECHQDKSSRSFCVRENSLEAA
jgi:hypothetical protein